MQQLESLAYTSQRVSEERQVAYVVGDLENLSATHLGYGNGGSPLGSPGPHGIVRTKQMEDIGSSSFLTSLRVDNVAKMRPLDRGEGIPTGPNSIGYFSAELKPLGSLEHLNWEEMATLLAKYSKKHSGNK